MEKDTNKETAEKCTVERPCCTGSNKYYRLLVTQDTILGPWEQQIGIKPNKRRFNEQVCFSPDSSAA